MKIVLDNPADLERKYGMTVPEMISGHIVLTRSELDVVTGQEVSDQQIVDHLVDVGILSPAARSMPLPEVISQHNGVHPEPLDQIVAELPLGLQVHRLATRLGPPDKKTGPVEQTDDLSDPHALADRLDPAACRAFTAAVLAVLGAEPEYGSDELGHLANLVRTLDLPPELRLLDPGTDDLDDPDNAAMLALWRIMRSRAMIEAYRVIDGQDRP